ncbi:Response regulator transcription factor [Sulfidibacter corallicola]|uniref:Response regulator transcription factor n=1 Tax=Sulfidibacter corallicola TaxID=2818388 RepID=A0A8A4TDC8_SULCO|nr:response regulator transcription factor [Sulfidibacter corallicola]QTD47663.1 response regulator transcription factor [Sulfidibacter corallicola]
MLEKKTIKVAIADDYQLLREALTHILSQFEDIEVVGEAADGHAALDLVRDKDVDILLLEPLIPKKDGIDLTKDVVGLDKKTRVVILTMDKTSHNAFRMLRAGAMGWLPKTVGVEEVLQAIRSVDKGKVFLPMELQRVFAEKYVRPESISNPEEQLSDREFQVMRLLALGNTNREISKMLYVGVKTVDTHRANLLRKLGLRNNSDLTRFAIQNGFVKF